VTLPAAIFCLERVLVTQAVEPIFARHLVAAGVRERSLAPLAGWSSRLLALGIGENALSVRATEAALAPASGWRSDDVRRAGEAAADELAPMVPSHGRVELEDHQAAGQPTVLVTALPEPLVTPFAERLGFDAVVATHWEASDGALTGRLAGPLMWGRERVRAVEEWSAQNEVALDQSFVYAGSFADVPLLGAAGQRRAVNPDARLAALAIVRRWPIRWFDVPPGTVKISGRELQEWLRPFADERLIANAQIEITGLEKIPRTGPGILVFNHRSYFDAPLVSLVLHKAGRALRGIGKKEVFDAPVIGAFAHAFGGIRVDRGTGSDEPLSRAIKALRAGEMIMISPEGTIPRG
jgi:putative phosphoserine phosphatase/1-acylglycerol-3-phosphate O-acyltransferase